MFWTAVIGMLIGILFVFTDLSVGFGICGFGIAAACIGYLVYKSLFDNAIANKGKNE
jgi:hypothetical protein